ncbi:maestro heat-like repeat-containing protein family member 7 [Athene cunicularia]|uniref:maestro heat-like repeat-containing protein family member 7 n=1 Tax=Athene cunicularia TaxID=194338 RepID=UPI000EF64A34|nr:maestro heat-like repeat-containing protein family member 7 [Athene cunicularia]
MTMVSGEYLQPSQRMDILLVAIEALTADDASDRQMGSDIVDMAVRDPASWLMNVPKVMRYIHKNVEHVCTEPARNSLDSLLLLLTSWSSREVVRSLLSISPTCDSAAMAMWEVMISMPWDLLTILSELVSVLEDCRERRVFSSAVDDACIYPLALLVCTDIDDKDFAALYSAQRFLRHPSPVMLSLVLTGLTTLSKTPETARKMLVLLPDITENFLAANADVRMKALILFINMMGHMKREEANLISLRLAEKLLPLFDDECSRVRELSIRLFKDVMKTMVGRNKRKMMKTAQSILVPLLFRMSDKVESVAKASRDTLSACGDFLGWRTLSSMAKTWQTDLIGQCLITHRKSRVDEYLLQCLPYLKDPQATVREAAVRFIGLAVRHRRTLIQESVGDICDGE